MLNGIAGLCLTVLYQQLLFQSLAVVEGVACAMAERDVAVVHGVERDEAHLLHIWLAVLGKEGFVAHDVEYFGYDIVSA